MRDTGQCCQAVRRHRIGHDRGYYAGDAIAVILFGIGSCHKVSVSRWLEAYLAWFADFVVVWRSRRTRPDTDVVDSVLSQEAWALRFYAAAYGLDQIRLSARQTSCSSSRHCIVA